MVNCKFQSKKQKTAEFDHYAHEYQNMLDQSLAPLGGFNDYYSRQKIALMKQKMNRNIKTILDFGCGLGATTLMLKETFPKARIVGTDVSKLSIDQARLIAGKSSNIKFGCISNKTFLAVCRGTFDVIFIANVFHHIQPKDRESVVATLKTMLAPKGKIFFFEHNPYNPLTRWVVSRCEFDKDAILLLPDESRRMFEASGFNIEKITYFLFFPHTLRVFGKLERFLSWLPIGAQYCVIASLEQK